MKSSEKRKYVVQAWKRLLKCEKGKKQRYEEVGPLSDQGNGKEQARSVQEVKELFKTATKIMQ